MKARRSEVLKERMTDSITKEYGALIHVIGKIDFASDMLNKPGEITNLEYQILKTHVE